MSERLTAEEIERIRNRKRDYYAAEFAGQSLVFLTTREVSSLLGLHDTIQRLQNLQPKDITREELESVNDEDPDLLIFSRRHIAAVCRGMLHGTLTGFANKAEG